MTLFNNIDLYSSVYSFGEHRLYIFDYLTTNRIRICGCILFYFLPQNNTYKNRIYALGYIYGVCKMDNREIVVE